MNIGIRNNQRKQRITTAAIEKKLAKLLRNTGHPDAVLSVLIVGDRAMRSLNRRWRRRDRTTDVLSFSFREGEFPRIQPGLLGDIVICAPQAARQAAAAGHRFDREIDLLLVHGLLHLLGYDHERSEREARRMQRRERLLLGKLSA